MIENRPLIRRLYARATLHDLAQDAGIPPIPPAVAYCDVGPKLDLAVTLVAEDHSGTQIEDDGPSFYIGGPLPTHDGQRMPPANLAQTALSEINDDIAYMLGRDPRNRPPKLSWGSLLSSLARHGLEVSEEELISTAITLELHQDVTDAIISAG